MVKGETVACWMTSYLGEAIDSVGFIYLHFFFQNQAEIMGEVIVVIHSSRFSFMYKISIIFHNTTGKTMIVKHGLGRQDFKHHAEQSNQ